MENQRCTLPPMHHRDKMCLDKLQHTHGSFITAGSTAYSIIHKVEALFHSIIEVIMPDFVTQVNRHTTNEITTSTTTLSTRINDALEDIKRHVTSAFASFKSHFDSSLSSAKEDIKSNINTHTDTAVSGLRTRLEDVVLPAMEGRIKDNSNTNRQSIIDDAHRTKDAVLDAISRIGIVGETITQAEVHAMFVLEETFRLNNSKLNTDKLG